MQYFQRLSLTFVILCILTHSLYAQLPDKPSPASIASAPVWAQAMYVDNPNVHQVDHLYKAYYRQHNFKKSYHTQYYKRWHRAIESYIQPNGHYRMPSIQEMERAQTAYLNARNNHGRSGGNWSVIGPMRVYGTDGNPKANHSNIYSMCRNLADTSVFYVGSETGEVYRSGDGGNTWSNVSYDFTTRQGVRAIATHPTDANIVLAGTWHYLHRSNDGGQTWTQTYMSNDFKANEILFHPDNPQIIFLAGDDGLWRSNDGGNNWTRLFTDRCHDIKHNVAQREKIYLVKRSPTTNNCEFLMSTDTGITFVPQTNGWYTSTDPDRNDGGARIAVSEADPNRVYAYLIGEAKTGDSGFIGVFRSTDGGTTWTNPRGQVGGPYSASVPNLAVGTATWNYHQGFYNCALMASNTNSDEILLGGLNLWRSTDGGATFTVVSGYRPGGTLNMHVDNQDFRAYGNVYWISTDGGMYRSTDFFTTQPTVRMDGINSSDYWGFGSGWNEDVLVGGLYHNGNSSWYENWPTGNFLNLGGGEAPTGYVNPGDSRKVFFSDIGGRYLPDNIGDPVSNLPLGLSPNEAYWSASSSELEWHPNCYNIGWLGRENKLWKTTDGAASFSEVHTFGTNPDHDITYIEISSSNPDVMYVAQQLAGSIGALWKTTDGGSSWNSLSTLPGTNTNTRKIIMSLDMEDENHLWIAYPDGSNGQKVFETSNGGQIWSNRTSSLLDGQAPNSIVLVQGTNNGVYFCSQNTVYYRDNSTGTWAMFNNNLPVNCWANSARPFYRDGKLRLATYGKGLWESEFHTQPSRPIARISVDHFSRECEGEIFNFTDHSALNHSGATWNWTFAGGTPTTSNQISQAVSFTGFGSHWVTLTVTDSSGQSSTDSMLIDITGIAATTIAEGFEAAFPPNQWRQASTGNLSWTQTNVGGYGLSASSAMAPNFSINATGTWSDLRAPVNMQLLADGMLTFDLAYAPYGGQYMDSLAIMVSTDCGMSFSRTYIKGGSDLATAPNQNTSYIPANSEWRTDSVDLSAYQGFDEIFIAFRNISNWGNNIYLDNIELDGTPLVGFEAEPVAGFAQIAPNPLVQGSSFKLITDQEGDFELLIWNAEGKLAHQAKGVTQGSKVTPNLPAGIYFYDLRGESIWKRGKLLVVSGR